MVDDEIAVGTADAGARYTPETVDDLERMRAFESEEYEHTVAALTVRDVDVVFCQKSVDERLRTLLARESVTRP